MAEIVDLSIVIVSFNTKAVLRDCLQSVFRHMGTLSHEVIVVDNDSKDGSAQMVRKEFPKTYVIANGENVGFSKANNIGIAKTHGRYVLFLNSDTVVPEKTFSEMVSFMDKTPDAGAATCFVALTDGTLDDASHRGFPTPWNSFCHFSGISKLFSGSMFFNGYNLGWRNLDKIHEIDALAGAFMIVRREAGEEANWWDEDYFFYGEDLDFCYMLKKKGWKIYFVPTVKILHLKGVSGGIKKVSRDVSPATLETKKRVTKARFAAMEIFYKKHYKNKYPAFITSLVMWGIHAKYRSALKEIGY